MQAALHRVINKFNGGLENLFVVITILPLIFEP